MVVLTCSLLIYYFSRSKVEPPKSKTEIPELNSRLMREAFAFTSANKVNVGVIVEKIYGPVLRWFVFLLLQEIGIYSVV